MAHNYIAHKASTQVIPADQIPEHEATANEMFQQACACLGLERDIVYALRETSGNQLRRLFACLPEIIECAPKFKTCIPALDQFSRCESSIGNLESYVARCKSLEELVYMACCPENSLYGDVSRHHYSSKNIIYLDQIVQDLGGDYVNSFPVPPTKKVRMEQVARPGYVPELLEAHFDLANDGTNYLALQIQFFVGNEPIGSQLLGSSFVDEDGRTKRVPFPTWRGQKGIKIGSAEKVAVEITVGGGNNLELATMALYLNVEGWAKMCLPPDRRPSGSC